MENQEQQLAPTAKMLNTDKIQTIDDVKAVFKGLGIAIDIEFAKDNGIEHLLDD